jgi:hypothetical protein
MQNGLDMAEQNEKKDLLKLAYAAFTDHPRQAGETYWQHMCFTVGMAVRLWVCSFLLLLHGILPFTLTHAASNRMKTCQKILAERAARTGFDEHLDGFGI